MRKITFIIVAMIYAMTSYAGSDGKAASDDQTLSGVVTNEQSEPVAFANIALLAVNDSSLIAGAVSKEDGTFTVECTRKDYIVRVSCVGYEMRYMSSREDISRIVLNPANITLKDVVVKSERPTITFKDGRFLVDISNSALSIGNTAESLMAYLPGVWKDGDKISINGISGTSIIVNDRTILLKGETLDNYLRSLRSERIERIEIIPNPSAEYSAEGAGGILKIVLKEREQGFTFVAAPSVSLTCYEAVTPYLYASYGSRKFGADISLMGTVSRSMLYTDGNTLDKVSDVTLADDGSDRIKDRSFSVYTEIYYEPDKYNRIALHTDFMSWVKDEDMNGQTFVGDGTRTTGRTDTWHSERQTVGSLNMSLNYRHFFDEKTRHSLLFMADWAHQYKYDVEDIYEYNNYDGHSNWLSRENDAYNQTKPYNIMSAEARYNGNMGKAGTLTGGVKYSYSDIHNTLTYENTSFDGMSDYDFEYSEKLLAFYAKYSLQRNKWNMTLGLRGEHDKMSLNEYNTSTDDFDFFPSVYFGYNVTKKNQLAFSYNRKISRTGYYSLMPQRFYQSKYSIMEGNPNLSPDYINNISTTFSINSKYIFTLTHVWSNNGISSFIRNEEHTGGTVQVQSFVDNVKRRMSNMNVYVPVKLTDFWSTVNQAQLNYNRYESDDMKTDNLNWSAYTQHTFKLPLNMRCVVLYRYMSSSKSAYVYRSDYHQLNLSLSKSMLNNSLYLSLAANKILCYQRQMTSIDTEYAYKTDRMYSKNLPYISFSVYYTFTKGKKKNFNPVEKSGEEEKSRAY